MLPYLASEHTQTNSYRDFLAQVELRGFAGDIASDLAARLTMATDNSVYQVLPQAVVYPRHAQDIQLLFQIAQAPEFAHIRFAPRGGGTGTDGQSLTSGIIIDGSRYLREILEINVALGFARIQPGVVLDQLNDALKQHQLFFAPNVAPSSRATIGGMFNTDACGKGSCCYGRTSQHVLEATCVLSDGTLLHSVPIDLSKLKTYQQLPGLVGDIYRQVDGVVTEHADEIEQRFPKLSRFLTGYNLAKIYDATRTTFNLNYLLAGSEGTLVFVTELKVKLTPIPKFTQLAVIQYAEFDDALCAARALLSVKPTAIETIDDKVLRLAKQDVIYAAVKPMLEVGGMVEHAKAINLIEFSGDTAAVVENKVAQLLATIQAQRTQPQAPLSVYVTADAKEMSALWDLRKKSVGLLGNLPGNRRPVPFIEDTVVPPEQLADYVRELRVLLDAHGLDYGMFGHVDAGCLHVRPALDTVDLKDAALIPKLSDAVNQLVKKYGGILWGEHGQGFRSKYAPEYFGTTLYHALRQIKTTFDPRNKLNPGKIASALGSDIPLYAPNGPMRGEQDRQINASVREAFQPVMKCNGNGQCFQYDPNQVMCPSSKVTRDRVHSPKGRATVMREWLRLLAHAPAQPTLKNPLLRFWQKQKNKKHQAQDFSQQVYQSMSGCLGCKGCSTGCPVKVDIPRFKAQFLAHYHTRYPRRLRDYVLARSESMLAWQSQFPLLSNMGLWLAKPFLKAIGLVDLPAVAVYALSVELRKQGITPFSMAALQAACTQQGAAKVVCILPDAVTLAYQPKVLLATVAVLQKRGFTVFVLPFRASGKSFHGQGFLEKFKAIAHANEAFYADINALGVALVGIEPSVTLAYRDEYLHALGRKPLFHVQLLQEFLSKVALGVIPVSSSVITAQAGIQDKKSYILFGHCSERALAGESQQQWQQLFAQLGLTLEIANVGCCGMAGSYGHEAEHLPESKGIFAMSWQAKLQSDPMLGKRMLVTGFSCACQTHRQASLKPQHPIEVYQLFSE